MTRPAAALAALLALATAAVAAPPAGGFVNKTFTNADGTTSPYVVFVPHTLDPKTPPPVMLFLHGSGETKGGSKQPVDVGIGPAIKKREKTFPFVVVIPQSEKRTWAAESDDGKRALAMLDAAIKEYHGDPKRVYLTGLSMGGFGTWSLAAAHPEKWAAIAPVCGGARTAESVQEIAAKVKDIPCWNFHGDADKGVPVKLSRDLIDAIKAAGGTPKYTEYPGVPHNSWDNAYGTDELYTWLLSNSKK